MSGLNGFRNGTKDSPVGTDEGFAGRGDFSLVPAGRNRAPACKGAGDTTAWHNGSMFTRDEVLPWGRS